MTTKTFPGMKQYVVVTVAEGSTVGLPGWAPETSSDDYDKAQKKRTAWLRDAHPTWNRDNVKLYDQTNKHFV